MGIKLKRYENNPILSPCIANRWESGAVFNCGATITKENKVILLYRAVANGYERAPGGKGYINYISRIGYAESDDGYSFSTSNNPVLIPDKDYDLFGCEDPRVTRFTDGDTERYVITYTAMSAPAFSGRGDRIAIAFTNDFITFTKDGVLFPDLNDKDAVIFPEKVNNRVAMLHRIEPDIQIVYFTDLEQMTNLKEEFWKSYVADLDRYTVLKRKFGWEEKKIGSGPPPLKTREGLLLFYHGVDNDSIYRCGVALLDLDNPSVVIARSPYPLLEPEEEYEKYGDVNNVVFPEGAVVLDERVFVYYGSGDKYCSLATINLNDLLDYLMGFKY